MRIADLTEQQILRYYETRMAGKRFQRSGAQYKGLCPFHDDRNPSWSMNPAKGGAWCCHGPCNIGGGLVEFETRLTGCDDQAAIAAIADIVGEKQLVIGRGPERTHTYTDANGQPVFRVCRIGSGKAKSVWQEIPDGKGRWLSKGAHEKARGLYCLPEVITAAHLFFVEGEAKADDLREALKNAGLLGKVAVTSSPLGAGQFREEYARDFIHKQVFILPDCDLPGRRHALKVATFAYPLANGVKIVELPGLPEKGDVADWLKQSHTVQELIALTEAAPWWRPAEPEDDGFFVGGLGLAAKVPEELPWLVKDIIPCGWNGFVVADPKSLKSFSVVDMLVSLATGQPWLGFEVPRRTRCALLAREDFWGLTARRIKHFVLGRGIKPEVLADFDDYLLVNTRAQAATWSLDNEDDLQRLITNLKRRRCEFLVMDVFRRLHFADESDNTAMQKILDRVTHIQAEVGCSICIVHHTNKDANSGSLFMRTRGASAIHGFMEWGIGLTTVNPDDPPKNRVRKMEFLSKAGGEPDPVFVKAEGGEENGWARLVITEEPKKKASPRRGEGERAASLMQ